MPPFRMFFGLHFDSANIQLEMDHITANDGQCLPKRLLKCNNAASTISLIDTQLCYLIHFDICTIILNGSPQS